MSQETEANRTRLALAIAGVAAVLIGAFLVRDALVPFVLGALGAYICAPAVDRLDRLGVPRQIAAAVSAIVAVLAVLVVPLLLLPLLVEQSIELFERHAAAIGSIWVSLGIEPGMKEGPGAVSAMSAADLLPTLADHASGTSSVIAELFGWFFAGANAIVSILLTLLIMPLVIYFLLIDWAGFQKSAVRVVPEVLRERVLGMAQICDRVLSEFLRAQLGVMVIMAVVYSLLLTVAGLPYAVVIGTISGFLVFIPYAGFLLGLLLAVLIAVVEFAAVAPVAWVIAVMLVGTAVESFVLTPWLIGNRTGLGPVSVLLALAVMGAAFGFVGILIAIPVAAILVALWRDLQTSS